MYNSVDELVEAINNAADTDDAAEIAANWAIETDSECDEPDGSEDAYAELLSQLNEQGAEFDAEKALEIAIAIAEHGKSWERITVLTSDVCMLHKSNGINSDAARWGDDPIVGEYERVDAPENWRDLIAEADECTAGCQPGQTEIGEESDWEWYCYRETDAQGFLTGIEWLAAKYVGE